MATLSAAEVRQGSMSPESHAIRAVFRTRFVFLLVCVVLGFLQAWATRLSIVNDTVSYLDIGLSIWHGHWTAAVNGLWNPLYAAILGGVVGVLRPSIQWEYPLVHLILFFIFLGTLWCYDFFLNQVILFRESTESEDSAAVPAWIWLSIGYLLFLWSSLRLIGVSETNPDMLVAAFFYAACGLLAMIQRRAAGWPAYIGFSVVLGLGYLTKSVMFPISIVCFAALAVMGRDQWKRVLTSFGIFLAICAPYILALSASRGHLTFGESGPYNYAVHVDQLPGVHWQGSPGSPYGMPLHPSRLLVTHPATYAFAGGPGGTYPSWTDPSYWYEGVDPRVSPRLIITTGVKLAFAEFNFLFDLHGSMLAGLFMLFYVSGRRWSLLGDIGRFWFLVVPCLAALSLYALVHVEPRYIAPFLDTLLFVLFLSPRLGAAGNNRRLVEGLSALLLVMYFLPIGSPSLNVKGLVRDILGRSQPDPDAPAEVVKGMYDLGLRPGDRIASLQWSLYGNSTWAHLARVRIAGEVFYWPTQPETSDNDFWRADPAVQESVIRALAGTGASFIVSELPPPDSAVAGWQRVGNSHYYAYSLRPDQFLSQRR